MGGLHGGGSDPPHDDASILMCGLHGGGCDPPNDVQAFESLRQDVVTFIYEIMVPDSFFVYKSKCNRKPAWKCEHTTIT